MVASQSLGSVNGLVGPAGPFSKIGKYFGRRRIGAAPHLVPLLSYSAAPTFCRGNPSRNPDSFAFARPINCRLLLSSSRTSSKMSPGDRMEGTSTPDPRQKPVVRIGGACFVCRAKKRKVCGAPASIHTPRTRVSPSALVFAHLCKMQLIITRFSSISAYFSLTSAHSAVVKSESRGFLYCINSAGRLLSACFCNQDRYASNAETPSSVANGPGNKSGRHIPTRPTCVGSGLIKRAITRRGLPKHHIRKLEARLRRTETLLRSLLHFVSDEQLESSLRDVAPTASMGTAQDKENADPDVWQFYPLATLEDVRAWQSRTTGPGLSEVLLTAHASDPDGYAPVDDDSVPSQPGGSSRKSDHSPCPIPAAAASPGVRTNTSQVDHFPGNSHSQLSRTSCGVGHTLLHSRAAEMTGAGEPSTVAGTFLPADFQKEFLW